MTLSSEREKERDSGQAESEKDGSDSPPAPPAKSKVVNFDYLLSKHVPNPRLDEKGCKTDLRLYIYITSERKLFIQRHCGIRVCPRAWDITTGNSDAQLTNTSQGGNMMSSEEYWPWAHIHSWDECRETLVVPLVQEYFRQVGDKYPVPQTLSMDVMLADEMVSLYTQSNA